MYEENSPLGLERFIARTEAEITILKTRIEELEKKIVKHGIASEGLATELYELKYKLSTLERHVSEVKEELEKLNSNAFLMFTKDFDLKKTVVLVSIIVSILSSPSIVSNFFQSSNQKYTPAKLDKLIELLEEQEK